MSADNVRLNDSVSVNLTDGTVVSEMSLYRNGHSTVVTLPSEILEPVELEQGANVWLEADRESETLTIEASTAQNDPGEYTAEMSLYANGSSVVVTLPPTLLAAAGLHRGDLVALTADMDAKEIEVTAA